MAGTHDDAVLLVELAKLAAISGVAEASRAIFADSFDPERAEASDPNVSKVLGFNETLGTLVKNDLLDRDLVYDWLWVRGVWDRVAPAANRARAASGVPQLFENFEKLALGQGSD
jgi:hypothetical protein